MKNARDGKKKFVSRSYINNNQVDFRNPNSLIRKPEYRVPTNQERPESSGSSDSDLDFVSCSSSRPPSQISQFSRVSMDSYGSHFPYSSVSDRAHSPSSNYSVTSTKTFNLTGKHRDYDAASDYDVTRSKSPARTVVGVYRHDSTDLFDSQQTQQVCLFVCLLFSVCYLKIKTFCVHIYICSKLFTLNCFDTKIRVLLLFRNVKLLCET